MIRFNKTDESAEKWMPCPKEMVYFPGQAYIYPLDRLIVAKKLDKLHQIMGLPNKTDVGYTIYNSQNEKVFLAVKKPDKNQCNRCFITVFNIYGNEVIQITKRDCCFFDRILVWAPEGNFAGSVEQCLKGYEVKDRNGTVVLLIKAKDDIYKVLREEKEVGVMVKVRDTDVTDGFGVNFPQELQVEIKAILVGACFLVK